MRTYFVIIFYTYSCIHWRSEPGHANANISVFIDRIKNQLLKK